MKKIFFTFLMLVAFLTGYSQMNNNGGYITVQSGATLVIEGDYTSTNAGTIEIDGDVVLKGDLVNNGGSVASGSTGDLIFDGTTLQEITGSQSTTFYCAVEVSNPAGIALTATAAPGASQVVDSSLILTDGKVKLNTFDLTISNEGITGAGAAKYIETNSTGSLINTVAAGGAAIAYPVGDSVYNPITIQNGGAGTTDSYGVRSQRGFPANWNPADHAVQGHWVLTEGTTGGSNLTLTPTWKNTQHQTNFQTSDCAVGLSKNNGTNITWAASGAATDNTPFFSKAGSTFDTVGVVMVGDYYFEGIEVDLDFWLAGPYNTGTGLMNTTLRNNNLVPLTDPYGLGNTVASVPSTVVDWIKVELRDKITGAISFTRAFFLDNTGNVLHVDGTSGAKFTGVPKDQYYIAVKHRNHLGARTNATVDLTAAGPAFNFKSNTGVFQNLTYTPQDTIATNTYGLYKGNVNQDGYVRKTGTPAISDYSAILTYLGTNLFLLNVYAYADVNMDANVRKTGTPAISDYTHVVNSCGTSLFIQQQIP